MVGEPEGNVLGSFVGVDDGVSLGVSLFEGDGLVDDDSLLDGDVWWVPASAIGAVTAPSSAQPKPSAAICRDRLTHGAMGVTFRAAIRRERGVCLDLCSKLRRKRV